MEQSPQQSTSNVPTHAPHAHHTTVLSVIAVILLVTGLYITLADKAIAPETDTMQPISVVSEASQPNEAILTGTFDCLEPIDPKQVHTEECKPGLITDDGKVYAVNFNLISKTYPEIQAKARISAKGVITPIEQVSTDIWVMYGLTGFFLVTSDLEVLN